MIYAVQGDGTRGMAGDSAAHADLIRNTGFALHQRLQGTPCSVKMTEMRLRVDAADAMFYPDVMVRCRPVLDPSSATELSEARLTVEVLSPRTQPFDRGQKLSAYSKLPDLLHIVLLSSLDQAAWVCHRVPADAAWSDLEPWPRGTTLQLDGLGMSLPWGEVYDGVGLDWASSLASRPDGRRRVSVKTLPAAATSRAARARWAWRWPRAAAPASSRHRRWLARLTASRGGAL